MSFWKVPRYGTVVDTTYLRQINCTNISRARERREPAIRRIRTERSDFDETANPGQFLRGGAERSATRRALTPRHDLHSDRWSEKPDEIIGYVQQWEREFLL